MYFFVAAQIDYRPIAQPMLFICYLNGPGNLGNLVSNKGMQPIFLTWLTELSQMQTHLKAAVMQTNRLIHLTKNTAFNITSCCLHRSLPVTTEEPYDILHVLTFAFHLIFTGIDKLVAKMLHVYWLAVSIPLLLKL